MVNDRCRRIQDLVVRIQEAFLDQAKKLYAELMEKYPQSDKIQPARQRLAALDKS